MEACDVMTAGFTISIFAMAIIIIRISNYIKNKIIKLLVLIFMVGIGIYLSFLISQYVMSKGCPIITKQGFIYTTKYPSFVPEIETQKSYLYRNLE